MFIKLLQEVEKDLAPPGNKPPQNEGGCVMM